MKNVVNFVNCPMAGGRTPESPPTNVVVNEDISTVAFAVPVSLSVVSLTKFAMVPGMVPALPGSPKIQHKVHVKMLEIDGHPTDHQPEKQKRFAENRKE